VVARHPSLRTGVVVIRDFTDASRPLQEEARGLTPSWQEALREHPPPDAYVGSPRSEEVRNELGSLLDGPLGLLRRANCRSSICLRQSSRRFPVEQTTEGVSDRVSEIRILGVGDLSHGDLPKTAVVVDCARQACGSHLQQEILFFTGVSDLHT